LVDGWSLSGITDEILAGQGHPTESPPGDPSQRAGQAGPASDLSEKPFRDYIKWLGDRDLDKALNFWRTELSGAEAASTPPALLGGEGQRDPQPIMGSLDKKATKTLKSLGLSHRLTLNNLLETALGLTLFRLNHLPTQIFCGLDSGRANVPASLTQTVGLLVNPVPTLLKVVPERSFLDHAESLQAFRLKARDFAATPLSEIRAVTKLDLGGLLMVMENQPRSRELGALTVERIPTREGQTELSVVFEWTDEDGQLKLLLHYDGLRYQRAQMEALSTQYLSYVERLAKSPTDPINSIDFLDESSKAEILRSSEGPARDFSHLGIFNHNGPSPDPEAKPLAASPIDADLSHLLSRIADKFPDAPALMDIDEDLTGRVLLTHGGLESQIRRLAGDLQKLGLGPGQVVGLNLPRGLSLATAALAVLRIGAAFTPMDPELPADRLDFALKDTQARLVISQPATRKGPIFGATPVLDFDLHDYLASQVVMDSQTSPKPSAPKGDSGFTPKDDSELDPNRLAYIIHTSGSTGKPKGVMVGLRGLTNLALTWVELKGISPGDVSSLYAPVAFDATIFEIFPGLLGAGTLATVPNRIRTDPKALADFFKRAPIDHAFLPPQVGQAVLAEGPRLKSLVLAGDSPGALRPSPTVTKLYNAYGPTEFTVCSSARLIDRALDRPSIGKPSPNTQTLILSPLLRLVPKGAIGEICLSGSQTALGYLGQGEETLRAFQANPYGGGREDRARLYRSGDLGFWDLAGEINFLGRRDNQIKIRGQRLEPGEVESVLTAMPEVANALVGLDPESHLLTAWINPSGEDLPEILARGQDGLKDLEEIIKRRLSAILPAWMWPVAYVFLPAFPQDAHGKIDRRALPSPKLAAGGDQPARDADRAISGPKADGLAELTEAITQVWAKVLGFSPEADDHFLALGGDSIKAMLAVASLREMGFSLDNRDFLLAGTPRKLAEFLNQKTGPKSALPEGSQNRDPKLDKDWPAVAARFGQGKVQDFFPLTPAQEGLLFHLTLEPDSPVYLEQTIFEIDGPLNLSHFKEAAEAISHERPALRTVFWPQAPSGALQVVLNDLPPAVSPIALPPVAQAPEGEALAHLIRDLASSELRALSGPKVLAEGPLLRLAILSARREKHFLCLSFNHLILDGWSVGLLVSDLIARLLPAAPKAGAPAPDSPPAAEPIASPDNFPALARELISERRPGKIESHQDFWRKELQGATPNPWPFKPPGALVEGPLKGPLEGYAAQRTYRKVQLELGPLGPKVASLARSLSVSSATILQALWGLLVSKIKDSRESLFGLVVSVRESAQVYGRGLDAMGLLINTVPRRLVFQEDLTFTELLSLFERQSREIGAQAVLSLTEALNQANLKGPASLAIDHLVVVENLPEPVYPPSLAIKPWGGTNYPGYDLAVTFYVPSSQMKAALWEGELTYSAEAFSEVDVRFLADKFNHLAKEILRDPNRPVSELSLLTKEEEERVLELTLGPPALSPPSRPWENPEGWGPPQDRNRPAVVWPGGTLTREELYGRVEALGERLRALGIGPGHLVAILLAPGAALAVSLLGALKNQTTYLPLDPSWPQGRLADILSLAKPSLLITQKGLATDLSQGHWSGLGQGPDPDPSPGIWSGPGLYVNDSGETGDLDRGTAKEVLEAPRDPGELQDIAYVCFTSGSTGRPKGVKIKAAALWSRCREILESLGLTEKDRSAVVFGPAFDAFSCAFYPVLLAGGEVRFPPLGARTDAVALRDHVLEHGLTMVNAPTVIAEALMALKAPPSLRILSCGGDKLDRFVKGPFDFYNEYGPTEATVLVARFKVESSESPIPIGRPLAGDQILVMGRDGHPRPMGLPGELCLSGPSVSPGYLDRDDLTAEAFFPNRFPGRDGPDYLRMYRTGDRGRFRPDGQLEFLGRLDRQLSLGGLRFEPSEIEARMMETPGVGRAHALAETDPAGDAYLTAYFTLAEDLAPGQGPAREEVAERIRARLAETLPRAALPKAIHGLEAFPLINNSKIDLAALRELGRKIKTQDGQAEPTRPADLTEVVVSEAVLECLGASSLDPEADFFSLGGDSIKAVRLVARLTASLGEAPKLSSVMNGFSVKSLAEDYRRGRYQPRESISEIKPGQGPALILVPDVGGGLWSYRELWRNLAPGIPVYALEPEMARVVEVVGQAPKGERLSAMMSIWKEAVAKLSRAAVPEVVPGVIPSVIPEVIPSAILVGLCLSGLEAWELASQLRRDGIAVKGVVALNTRTKLTFTVDGQEVTVGPDREPPESLIADLYAGVNLYEGQGPPPEGRSDLEMAYAKAILMALADYRPQPRDQRLWSLRPQEPYGEDFQPFEKVSLGWEDLALGGHREIRSPGHHYQMLGPKSAPHLAKILEGLLRAEAPSKLPVPLSPIQKWYFSLGPESWPLYQSLTLKTQKPYPVFIYRAILNHLTQKHPALRAAFQAPEKPGAEWVQTIEPEGRFSLTVAAGPDENLWALWAQTIKTLDQAKDPLITALLSPGNALAGDTGDTLFLAIHHLIIDGVSWRLLGRDFNQALESLDHDWVTSELAAAAALAKAPPPTANPGQTARDGYRAHAERLAGLAKDQQNLAKQRRLWGELLSDPPEPFRLDSKVPSPEVWEVDFSVAETARLARSLKPGLGLRELTLAALVQAAFVIWGLRSLLVNLEGHGREGLSGQAPYSEVGWFTSLYPLILRAGTSLDETLDALVATLAKVPDGGLGYGILKYLANEDPLPSKAFPHLVFNYQGNVTLADPGPNPGHGPGPGPGPGSPDKIVMTKMGTDYDLPKGFANPGVFSFSAYRQDGRLKATFTKNYPCAFDLTLWGNVFTKVLTNLGHITTQPLPAGPNRHESHN
jgi:amino acid adenylation domain-containing protein